MCFDAWIANTDRHAENWGIIAKSNNINVLAPTFDQASSLGRNESDENRIKRMQTKIRVIMYKHMCSAQWPPFMMRMVIC